MLREARCFRPARHLTAGIDRPAKTKSSAERSDVAQGPAVRFADEGVTEATRGAGVTSDLTARVYGQSEAGGAPRQRAEVMNRPAARITKKRVRRIVAGNELVARHLPGTVHAESIAIQSS